MTAHAVARAREMRASGERALVGRRRGRFSHHLRINFGHPENKKVEEALRTVGKIARALLAK